MWITNSLIPGVIVGFLASIPLGPIGVLCIQRTLSKNLKAGFISGLGATLADAIFSAVALLSLSLILSFIETHRAIITIVGGACIIAVGMNILFKNPVVQIRRNRSGKTNLWQDFISIFLLTLTNPAFILVFIAFFASFGISSGESRGIAHALPVILGVVIGSATWWLLLTFVVSRFRTRFRPRHLLWINRIAGSLIIALGAIAITTIFFKIPELWSVLNAGG